MEDKRLKRVFDRVRLSPEREEAILEELLEDRRAERRGGRYRAAALAAAVLAVVLAGTALAAEIIGRVQAELIGPNEAGISTEGCRLIINAAPLPLEELSEEALEGFAGSGEAYATWYFNSWAEAADFLGLELPRNALLSGLRPASCFAGGAAPETADGRLPAALLLSADYQVEECQITEIVYLEMEPGTPEIESFMGREPGQWEMELKKGPYDEKEKEFRMEEYALPGGAEAVIVSRSGEPINHERHDSPQVSTAYFVWESAFYTVHCHAQEPAEETAMLKKILDAYK